MYRASHRLVPVTLALALVAPSLGCGSAPPPTAKPKAPSQEPASKPTPPPVPEGHLGRMQVEDVLLQGPPWLLARVEVEAVVRGGQFIGWELLDWPPNWDGAIDLQRGDIIRTVNGKIIERPDQLWDAWRTVASAQSISIDFERDGDERSLALPIAGDPSPDIQQRLEQPPTAQPKNAMPIQNTIVISGE